MKFLICFNWSFLLAVSFVACGLADEPCYSIDDSSDSNAEFLQEPNKRFQKNLDCISRSENPELRYEFLEKCHFKLPERIFDALYEYSVYYFYHKTHVACTKCEELYYSAEFRRKMNICIFREVGELSDDEREKVDYVYNCTEKYAKEVGCAYGDSS